eukprot:145109_1
MGTLVDFTIQNINGICHLIPKVKIKNKIYSIPPDQYQSYIHNVKVSSIEMLPIEFGAAMTIEGVQGLEFIKPDDIIIADVSEMNKIGAFYTLESRVRDTKQIYFIKKPNDWNDLIKIHPYVKQFYSKLQKRTHGNYDTPSINKCSTKQLKNKFKDKDNQIEINDISIETTFNISQSDNFNKPYIKP